MSPEAEQIEEELERLADAADAAQEATMKMANKIKFQALLKEQSNPLFRGLMKQKFAGRFVMLKDD